MRALLAKADALLALNKESEAMDAYRAVLTREEESPKHQSTTYVRYPYLVATLRLESEYDHALKILKKHVNRLMFPVDTFMWYASKAIIENNPEYAKKALDVAEIKKSGFRFHQNLGLVGKEHEKTVKDLFKKVA